jgi:Rieske Fe-S protein
MSASNLERREFVALCAAAASSWLAGCVSMVTHPVPVTSGRLRIAIPEFPDLAQPNGAIKLQPAGHPDPVYVLSGPAGFSAVSPICTHRGCTVDVSGARLVCPCHGSTYDREGRVLKGPAERALARYPVAREGDALIIDLGGPS